MTDKAEKKTNNSSENNSIAEFAKATSVAESNAKDPGEPAKQGAVDETTEVSPTDKGAEDDLDETIPPKETEDVEEAKDVQEVGAHIGRPDSKVTSNSPEKKAEPVEHVDLDKSA